MNDATALPRFGPLPEDLATLRLPANALLLLDKLRFFYCRGGRRFCWPSDAELSRRTGLSIHQVRRGLRRLQRAGLIDRRTTTRALPDGRIRRRRFIVLTFLEPGAGAQPDQARVPIEPGAPARNQEVVSSEGKSKFKLEAIEPRERRPSETATASPIEQPGEMIARETNPTMPPTKATPAAAGSGVPRNSPPCPPQSDEGPGRGSLGEAMCRVFQRLGVEPPKLTPVAESAGSGSPPKATSVPSPAGSSGPARRRKSLSVEELEQLAGAGDRVLQLELERRRAAETRRQERAAIPPPRTTAELLGRLREDPSFVAQATQALAVDLGDERSWRALHGLCRRAFEGDLDPRALVHAYSKARGPNVRRPGAIFMVEVARWRPR